MLTVKEMLEDINKMKVRVDPLPLNEFTYVETTTKQLNHVSGITYEMGNGNIGYDNLLKRLGVNNKLSDKLTPQLRQSLLNHLLSGMGEANITSTEGMLLGVYDAKKPILSQNDVANSILEVFNENDVVTRYNNLEGFQAYVHSPELFVDARKEDRTQGGVYISAMYGEVPTVSVYLERLICSNGMVSLAEYDKVRITGQSNGEIIMGIVDRMKAAVDQVIPNYLNNWSEMTRISSGNPEQLIHRLAKENGINPKLESRIIEEVPSIEADTYYDIVNLMTSFQHAEGVPGTNQFDRLLVLGGNAVQNMGGHRCNNCQHSLES
jgi:hypothetical protein